MHEKELNIARAAIAVITRYGVRRTTMHDIAEAAGIARQTLYNSFENKNAVLRGTIQLHSHETMQAFARYFSGPENLEKGLDIAFQFIALEPYEIVNSNAHGDEFFEEINAAAKDELRESYAQFKQSVAKILVPYSKSLKKNGLTATGLSDMYVVSLIAFKKQAKDKENLQQLYRSLKVMILNVCDQK